MMVRAYMCCLVFAFLGAASAAAQRPRTVGVFRDAPTDYIVIAPMGNALLLAETRSEQLRVLFPAAGDTFHTGPALTQPTPIERTWVLAAADTLVTLHGKGRLRSYPRIRLRSEDIEVRSGDVVLKGTLLSPVRGGKRPAIVLAHGSENNDRHSFGPLPWVFAAHGYAVLIYDKRGTGSSTGSWQSAGIEPLASDLARAVEVLARRGDIDARRIGVVGVSEGAWVAAHATVRTQHVSAIAAISGGARTKGDAYIYKNQRLAMAAGLRGAPLDSAVAVATSTITEARRRVQMDSATASAFDRRVTFDPSDDWRTYRGPFLYLGGAADVLEDAAAAAKWYDELFRATGHSDYTIKLMPDAHHSLLHAVHGTPSEFASLERIRELVPGYWSVLLHWLDGRLR